ncbi:hypothetical protein PLEI_3601 [Photobacterium leiognathi lrivu.4.1]|uniref:Uncharacterized protein n=1 Tax=Photobacterium leiognathi lrivu.4.1 TaxID=1248232 RepID=V5F3J1_PHOLE|nr:hypothetical protein PLEI_3601 [Photobacterium leiognathi lrivu.4.1]
MFNLFVEHSLFSLFRKLHFHSCDLYHALLSNFLDIGLFFKAICFQATLKVSFNV